MNDASKTETDLFGAVREFISGHSSFLLLTHVGPDGDGLLACIALSQHLRARKKKATIAVEGSYPSFVAPYDPEGLVRTLEELSVHEDWEDFLRTCSPRRMAFCSTKTDRSVYDASFADGDYLVFGNETSGLPPSFYQRYREALMTIPMPGRHARSHNLANAVSIVLYEALRQTCWSRG